MLSLVAEADVVLCDCVFGAVREKRTRLSIQMQKTTALPATPCRKGSIPCGLSAWSFHILFNIVPP